MYSTTASQIKTNTTPVATKQQHIFVLQLQDGRYAVGQSHNPYKRIASINGGMNKAIPQALQVSRIIGIKDVNETRSLPSVTAKLCRDFGDDKVLCL